MDQLYSIAEVCIENEWQPNEKRSFNIYEEEGTREYLIFITHADAVNYIREKIAPKCQNYTFYGDILRYEFSGKIYEYYVIHFKVINNQLQFLDVMKNDETE